MEECFLFIKKGFPKESLLGNTLQTNVSLRTIRDNSLDKNNFINARILIGYKVKIMLKWLFLKLNEKLKKVFKYLPAVSFQLPDVEIYFPKH